MPDKNAIPPMQKDDLYREDVFTDRNIGTIRRMTPVTSAGETDAARPVLFVGSTQLLTQAGPLPLTFEIDAESLDQAVERFSQHAEEALKETLDEIAAMRREQASSLVIPDARSLGGLGGPGGPGRPGGKLVL
jgi:hypothetical protein